MSQDTRKDKRAKVVSLNVRYKSATVDEFIENHSHDVSKGGIFVKTPTPFPPGTLLKFEIRLAGDKSVISGVGRVVWKREPTQAASDKPAGMGVKFIKIDDASRAVIDKLIAQKAGAGSAYTSDPAALEDEKPTPNPTTLRGIAVAPATSDVADAAAATAAAAPAGINVPSPSGVPAPSRAPVPGASIGPSLGAPARAASAAPTPTGPGTGVGGSAATAPDPTGSGASSLPGAPSPGASSLQKTIPLGTSPFASLPKPTPGAPSVAPKPGLPAVGPPPPMAIKPATALSPAVGPTAKPAGGIASMSPQPQLQPSAGSALPPPPVSPGSLAPRPGAPPPRPPAVNPRKATMMGVALPATGSAPGAAGGFGPPREPAPERSAVPGPGEMPTPMVELIPMPPEGIGEKTETSGPSAAATAAAATPMFPKMEESRRDIDSVKEPTVMKQAAELLEEALREAGGSLDEIGQNPLFSNSSQRNQAVQESVPESQVQSGDTLMMTTPFAPKTGSKTSASPEPPASLSPASAHPASAQPASAHPASSRSAAASPSVSPSVGAKSVPPAPPAPLRPVGASVARPEKKGGGGLVAGLVVVALLVGGGVYAVKSGLLGGGGATPSTTTSAPPATASVPPVESARLAVIADAAPAAALDDASAHALVDGGMGSRDASMAMVDAGLPAVATVVAPPPPRPRPRPKPVPTATATATTDPSETPTSTATSMPTSAPTAEKPERLAPERE